MLKDDRYLGLVRRIRGGTALLLCGFITLSGGCGAPAAPEEVAVTSSSSPASAAIPQEEVGLVGDLGSGPFSARPAPLAVRPMTDEERRFLGEQKARIPSRLTPAEAPRLARDRAVAAANALPSGSEVRLLIKLEDVAFDFGQLHRGGEAARQDAIARRQDQLRPSQDRLEAGLRGAGARDVVRLWLGGNDVLATVPAREVERISRLPGVTDVELDEEGGQPSTSYTGLEARQGLLTSGFVAHAYDGNLQGRSGASNAVRIGIIEHSNCQNPITNWPARAHVGFLDVPGSLNRIKQVYDCSSGTCYVTSASGGSTHGTWVSGIAAGSIEQGQDSSFPGPNNYPLAGTTAQQTRSGQAPEAEVYYYGGICAYSAIRAALERAVADGVDIVNMSFAYETNCDRTLDHDGVNAALSSAMSAGVLNVAAAGNTSTSLTDACNLAWPGWRPNVLNVTGLNTFNSATPFRDLNIEIGNSAIGGMSVRTFQGVTSTVAGLGLAAPATYNLLYGAAPNSYTGDGLSGTSFASPTVAGAAADLRMAFKSLGYPDGVADGHMLMTMLFAMGDAWNGQNVTSPGGSVFLKTGVSKISGYGRPRVRYPSSDSLAGAWGWGWRSATIYHGQTLTYPVWDANPESSLLTEWKFALTWDEPDLSNIADIDISVWNTCPAGGGAAVQVASQSDYDYRNRIRLAAADIGGKCLEMRVYGYNVPPQGRTLYMTDFFHGGTPNP